MRRSLKLLKSLSAPKTIIGTQGELKPYKILGKRHSIYHLNTIEKDMEFENFKIPTRNKMTSPFLEFKRAAVELPKIEKEIEKSYLEELSGHLTPLEQEELKYSWKEREKRADNERYISLIPGKSPVPPDVEETDIKELKFALEDPINPNYEDIGEFFEIEPEKAKQLFMNGCFGTFIKDHYSLSKRFDVMLREETFHLINMLKASKTINKNEYPDLDESSTIENLEPIQQLGWLITNHAQSYLEIYHKINSLMLDYVYSTKNLNLYNIMRNSSDLFTSTVGIIVQELAKSQLFKVISHNIDFNDYKKGIESLIKNEKLSSLVSEILEFYAKKIESKDDLAKVVTFSDFVEHISSTISINIDNTPVEISLEQYLDLEKRFNYPKVLKDDLGRVGSLATGAILTGTRGIGKSQILAGLAVWASLQEDWVLIRVPRGSDFTRNAAIVAWDPSGLYIAPEIGQDILREILANNKEKLEKIKINPQIYGKYSLAGFHPVYDKGYEPLPTQKIFLRDEQVWTDVWKEYYTPEMLEEMLKGIRHFVIPKRRTYFEYELEKYSEKVIPDLFNQIIDENDKTLDDISFELIYDIAKPKRKPKKRMLPPSPNNILKLLPKKINSHDLYVNQKEHEMDEGNFVGPLTDYLPSPSNLKEIVEFGIDNPLHSNNVLYELMEHLYKNDDLNVLVLVDEFNQFFIPSGYPSAKYANYKKTRGCIPPSDLALSRLFMRFDGHMIKNGAKIVAVSEKTETYSVRSKWQGDPLNQGLQSTLEVSKIALDDLRKLIYYYKYFKWTDDVLTQKDIAAIHMLSQGNPGLVIQNLILSPEKLY
jgi:Mitochondrial ribosomal death-associated protein 3